MSRKYVSGSSKRTRQLARHIRDAVRSESADPPRAERLAAELRTNPFYVWLLLALPYARPSAVHWTESEPAKDLERRGLLERDPSATYAIWRCTELGEDVAQALLRHFGRNRT